MPRLLLTTGYIIATILALAGGINTVWHFQQLQHYEQPASGAADMPGMAEPTAAALQDRIAYDYLCLLLGISLFTALTLGQLVGKQRRQLALQATNQALLKQVAEAKDLTRQLSYQASHDDLTGLINRREFERRLQVALQTARQRPVEYGLCFLDLDNFKIVNDVCGHSAGDELLKRFARLLTQQVRQTDAVARLGSDEFALLIENCSAAQARRVTEQLRSLAEHYRFPYGKKVFDLKVTIGLLMIDQHSGDLAQVLQLADRACHIGKEQGRNRVHVWQNNDIAVSQRNQEMQWVSRINRALEENRFHLYVQPIVPVVPSSDKGKHYELLLRMQDEQGRIIGPGQFLPAAERYNLSTQLDRWVISQILQWLRHNPHELAQLELCSINLSGRSLSDESLLTFIQRSLWETQVPAQKICFEVTETAAIATLAQAVELIDSLKQIGCRFALDDFGTGFSSFAYLKSLPVDYLKIDGLFVKDLASKKIDYAMVKSISELGHVMGMKMIAEYVENRQILQLLRQIGVDYAQGFYIGKPQWIESASDSLLPIPKQKKSA